MSCRKHSPSAPIPARALLPGDGPVTLPAEQFQSLIWSAGQALRRLEQAHADARHPSAIDLAIVDGLRFAIIHANAAAKMRNGGTS